MSFLPSPPRKSKKKVSSKEKESSPLSPLPNRLSSSSSASSAYQRSPFSSLSPLPNRLSSASSASSVYQRSPFSSPPPLSNRLSSHRSPFYTPSPLSSSSSSLSSSSFPSIEEYLYSIEEKKEKIGDLKNENICNLIGYIPDKKIKSSIGSFHKLGEQGENSIVYKIEDNEDEEGIKGISLKIMRRDSQTKREIEFYYFFSDRLSFDYINFPFIYSSFECDACNIEKSSDTDDIKCLVVLSELYDGSLLSKKGQMSDEEVVSLLCQLIKACSILKEYEIVHGDLHSGNVLYKNIKDETMEINGYTLKTFGKLWVLWDFGNMTFNGEIIPKIEVKAINTIITDFHKILKLLNKNFINTDEILFSEDKTPEQLLEHLSQLYPSVLEKL